HAPLGASRRMTCIVRAASLPAGARRPRPTAFYPAIGEFWRAPSWVLRSDTPKPIGAKGRACPSPDDLSDARRPAPASPLPRHHVHDPAAADVRPSAAVVGQ